MKNLVIYGGTFDPPHYGHLNTARAVLQQLHFERLVFLPCKAPVLKETALASSEHRVSMLKLAIANAPKFEIDTREITRDTPSYMVETLKSFHQEFGENIAITLCMGMDAFKNFTHWNSWKVILSLAHLLVIKRANIDEKNLPDTLKKLLLSNLTTDPNDLRSRSNQSIYFFDAGQYPISSTCLREQVKAGHNIEEYVPTDVYHYIKTHHLYLK